MNWFSIFMIFSMVCLTFLFIYTVRKERNKYR
jgi:hypothetical protein